MSIDFFQMEEDLNMVAVERTCPPVELLDSNNEIIIEHIKYCQYCRDLLSDIKYTSEKEEMYLDKIKEDIIKIKNNNSNNSRSPKKGEIYQIVIKDKNSTYDGTAWRNPPMVIVVEDENDTHMKGIVRVAQISDATSLKSKGDVLLNDEVFAESWNIYPVSVGLLSGCIDKIDENIINKVIELSLDNSINNNDDDLIYTFRNLERYIGSYYAQITIKKYFK